MSSQLYNPNVPPMPETSFPDSQPLFLTNFLQLYNNFAVNHIPLDAATAAGDHTIVELVEQPNSQQTPVSAINIYAKDVIGQTDQVFFRYQGNGQEFQYSNYQIYPVPVSGGVTMFFTFLPGGILVYFGSFTSLPANNNLQLTPAVAKNIITVSFCPMGTNNQLRKPKVVIPTPQNGYITSINVTNSQIFNSAPPACYFLVMANT